MVCPSDPNHGGGPFPNDPWVESITLSSSPASNYLVMILVEPSAWTCHVFPDGCRDSSSRNPFSFRLIATMTFTSLWSLTLPPAWPTVWMRQSGFKSSKPRTYSSQFPTYKNIPLFLLRFKYIQINREICLNYSIKIVQSQTYSNLAFDISFQRSKTAVTAFKHRLRLLA